MSTDLSVLSRAGPPGSSSLMRTTEDALPDGHQIAVLRGGCSLFLHKTESCSHTLQRASSPASFNSVQTWPVLVGISLFPPCTPHPSPPQVPPSLQNLARRAPPPCCPPRSLHPALRGSGGCLSPPRALWKDQPLIHPVPPSQIYPAGLSLVFVVSFDLLDGLLS